MNVYGVANNSPDQVGNWLKNLDFQQSEIYIVDWNEILQDVPKSVTKHKIFFFLHLKSLLINWKYLKRNSLFHKKYLFVFSSPVRLLEQTGIIYLDIEKDASSAFLVRLLPELDRSKFSLTVSNEVPEIEPVSSYLGQVIEQLREGSLLTPLMTFLYTLPSASHQIPIKRALAKWFVCDGKRANADLLLEKIKSTLSLSEAVIIKLQDILFSEAGKEYVSAFKYLRKHEVDVSTIVKKFKVTSYEIQYLCSVNKQSENVLPDNYSFNDYYTTYIKKGKNHMDTAKRVIKGSPAPVKDGQKTSETAKVGGRTKW